MYGYGYGNNGYGNNGYGGWGVPNAYGQTAQPVQNPQQPNRFQNIGQQADASVAQKSSSQVPWVNGEVGAQAFMISPGSSVMLMDSDNPVFYIKSSDASGRAMIKTYRYEEVQPSAATPTASSYITRDEFEKFKRELLEKQKEGDVL